MKKNFGTATCQACGVVFKPLGPGAKFCSLPCRFGKGNCNVCGILFQKTSPNRQVCDKCQQTPQDAPQQAFTAIHGFYRTPDRKPPKSIQNGKCGHCGAPTQRKKPPVSTFKAFCSDKCHKTYRKGFFAANSICVCCEAKPVIDGKRTCVACRVRNSRKKKNPLPQLTPIHLTDKWRIEQALKYPFAIGITIPSKPPEWACKPLDHDSIPERPFIAGEVEMPKPVKSIREMMAQGIKLRTILDRKIGLIR